MKNWIYQNEEINEIDIEKYYGFVYCITNNITGKMYIGKKILKFKKKLPPLKGKKRKRIKYVESDWKKYYGSSESLKNDLEEFGEGNFTREIISLHISKTSWTYGEVAEQFKRDVLYALLPSGDRAFYNDNISGRFYPHRDILNERTTTD